jgi:hypothetical protein
MAGFEGRAYANARVTSAILIDACRRCGKIIGPEFPGRNLFETEDDYLISNAPTARPAMKSATATARHKRDLARAFAHIF